MKLNFFIFFEAFNLSKLISLKLKLFTEHTPAAKRSISKFQKTKKRKLAVPTANKHYYLLRNKENKNAARRERYRIKSLSFFSSSFFFLVPVSYVVQTII